MNTMNLARTALCAVIALGLGAGASADVQSFEIDSGHTHVSFSVDRFGFNNTLGVFPDSSGTIFLDENDVTNSSVTASVETASVWTGLAERDGHVRGEYWLNVEKHTGISFKSTEVMKVEDKDYLKIKGDLTIWGETRPVVFKAKINKVDADRTAKGKKAVGISAKTTIKRSEFGHKTAEGFVGDEVLIRIETIAHLIE